MSSQIKCFVWGSNCFGQLGLGDELKRFRITELKFENQELIKVATNNDTSLVLTSAGVYIIGKNTTKRIDRSKETKCTSFPILIEPLLCCHSKYFLSLVETVFLLCRQKMVMYFLGEMLY